jgi:ribosomal protein S18
MEPNPISSKYQYFELQLLKLQRELQSSTTQLLEQQRITNNLIKQNAMALKQIKELSNFINIPPNLEHIDYSDLDTLKNLINEL